MTTQSVEEADMQWATEEARKLEGQPRPRTRPLREFIDELRAPLPAAPGGTDAK